MLECTGSFFVRRSSRSQRNEWTLRQRNAHIIGWYGIWGLDVKRTKILLKIALSGWLKPGEFWSFHFDTVIAYSIFMYWKVGEHLTTRWNPARLGKQLLFKPSLILIYSAGLLRSKGKCYAIMTLCKPTTLWFTDHSLHSFALRISQCMPISLLDISIPALSFTVQPPNHLWVVDYSQLQQSYSGPADVGAWFELRCPGYTFRTVDLSNQGIREIARHLGCPGWLLSSVVNFWGLQVGKVLQLLFFVCLLLIVQPWVTPKKTLPLRVSWSTMISSHPWGYGPWICLNLLHW